ncbi:MAG: hypothetical protein ACR2OH_09160 [Microthrixaceae bacterium]
MKPLSRSGQPSRGNFRLATICVLGMTAATVSCGGGSDDLMSRQDFVDNLQAEGGELLDENISSCMYDGLDDDAQAREAVEAWQDGDAVPEELLDLAVECLKDLPPTPGT